MLEVVTGASLAALTDAVTQHLSGSNASNSVPLEYKMYPNKEDLPTDLHKASPFGFGEKFQKFRILYKLYLSPGPKSRRCAPSMP